MKTHYILSTLLALGVLTTSSQLMADGLTYDPYENYYSEYYGINAADGLADVSTDTADFYEKYYNTSYDADGLATKKQSDVDLYEELADPTNYYKW